MSHAHHGHDTPPPGDCDCAFTRRAFLHRGLALASLTATTPMFLERSAQAMSLPLGSLLSSQPGVPEDHVLVVVQLGGGNDGLNTVVPFGDATYYRRRPQLAIPAPGDGDGAALPLPGVDGLGLNPRFRSFMELLDDGAAAIVQGVGYPNPNRSHFTSMDIWHTANASGQGHGWIGRYFDNTCGGTPEPEGAIAIGNTAPLAMHGRIQQPVSFESAEMFRWAGRDLHDALGAPYDEINRAGGDTTSDDQASFLLRTALDAQVASDRIRKAVAREPLARYPQSPLSRQLRMIGAMIRDGMRTRVYYATQGGFDTHANQSGQHGRLLEQVGGALKAFRADLVAQGNSGRVLTMVFSEFGRRVTQNASGGTDHGTAAPMYLVGDMVRPGVLGTHPSLTDLDEGDLKFNVDFRSVYAAILENWMGAKPDPILGGAYRPAKIFA